MTSLFMMFFPYIVVALLLLRFTQVTDAYPGMTKEYSLLCPDGTPAVAKGLHACCDKPPYNYSVLCVLISTDYVTSCTSNCDGTIKEEAPHCENCICYPVDPNNNNKDSLWSAQDDDDDDKDEGKPAPRFHGCPFKKGERSKLK